MDTLWNHTLVFLLSCDALVCGQHVIRGGTFWSKYSISEDVSKSNWDSESLVVHLVNEGSKYQVHLAFRGVVCHPDFKVLKVSNPEFRNKLPMVEFYKNCERGKT